MARNRVCDSPIIKLKVERVVDNKNMEFIGILRSNILFDDLSLTEETAIHLADAITKVTNSRGEDYFLLFASEY